MRRLAGPCALTLAVLAGIVTHAALFAQQPPAQPPPFNEWLAEVRREAIDRGIRPEIVDTAFKDVTEPLPVILERDRTQAEVVLSLEEYVSRQVTTPRVRTGRQMLNRHRAVLTRVSEQYGVPPSVIVAIWGMESNFGRFTGTRPIISALTTLAWDPRRATFFRRELFNALDILNSGDIDVTGMRGSWAGAMGQPQFMPSSYVQHAVDFDGDGRRNIWTSTSDVFASIANYLKGYGWVEDYRWGREVAVSADAARRIADQVGRRDGTCQAKRDMTIMQPLASWQELGVRLPGGGALPRAEIDAGLVSGAKRHFLVYHNYDVILGYNCAHAYAISVGLLAERIGS